VSRNLNRQLNDYKGMPERAWLTLEFQNASGSQETFELVADTGSPYPIVVATEVMDRFEFKEQVGLVLSSNFGTLRGGWLSVRLPQVSDWLFFMSFASQQLANSVRDSSTSFVGVVGLPFLQQFTYGGNQQQFWTGMPE